MTREAVLSVLRPGEMTTERPFRTLRERGAASEGLAVRIRTPGGHVLGRIQLYSSLNADAARAYRLQHSEIAKELAERAFAIERSSPAQLIREAVASMASRLPIDPLAPEAPAALRRYLGLRKRAHWKGLDSQGLVREWLSRSDAWLMSELEHRDVLVEAAADLDRAACQAREDVLGDDASTVSTFYGVVRRMDVHAVEVEGVGDQALLIARDDMERQGLAVLGQPVAVLREVLPNGGSYSLPMPAVAMEQMSFESIESPWETELPEDGIVMVSRLQDRDARWIDRELAREPTAILASPLPIM